MTARGKNNSSDWDPMKDDYNNSSYDAQYQDNNNSGRSGQSLDHQKLYITNIPEGLNEDGLRAAFEKYGQLELVFLSRDPVKRFGLIRYETAAEARIAMMKLNKTEPLNLNVFIAHMKNNSGAGKNSGENGNQDKERDRGQERGRDRGQERGYDRGQGRDRDRGHRDSGSYVSSSSRERTSRNQDEPVNSEMESNADSVPLAIDRDFHIELEQIKLEKLRVQEEQLKCKQKLMMLKMEKQPTSNSNMATGGSTRRMMPDGRIIVQTEIEKTQEVDKSITAGAGDSRMRRQTCNDCGAAADMYCARCGVVPYCSAQCQRRDWHKRHKAVCHNLVRLSSAGTGNSSGVDANEDDEMVPLPPAPLRRPRSPNPNRNQQRDRAQPNNFNKDMKQKTAGEPHNNFNNNKARYVPPDHHPQPAAAPRIPNTKNNSQNNNTKDEENWGEKKAPEPKPVLKSAAVETRNEPPKQTDIKTELPMKQTPAKPEAPAMKPNARMGAILSNQSQPAEIALVPAQFLIEKLPIGESFLLSVDHLAENCATQQPGFVCLVLHADYQDQFNLLLEDIFEGECPYTPRPGDTFAYLDPSDGGWYRARCLSRSRAALLDSGKVVSLSPADQCRALANKYKEIPEFCCVLAGNVQVGMSLKCTVLMQTGAEYRVSIDVHGEDTYLGEGCVVRWLPTVQRDQIAKPVSIENGVTTTPVKEEKPQIKPTTPQPKTEKPQTKPSPKPETQIEMIPTKAATPKTPEVTKPVTAKIPEVPRPPIINNGRYYLMHVTSLKRACIRPCSAKSTAEFEGILQDVLLYGVQKSKQLTSPPQPGDLVLSLFEDIHYRALVRRTKAKDNRYMIEYVEYGNEEIVSLENLYMCPAELDLSSRPAQASTVQLSTIASVELTPPALQFIDGVKELEELIANIPGGTKTVPSGSLVELVVEKNREIINKTLEKMCTPDWKKLEESGGDVIDSEVVLFPQMKSHPLPTDREFDMDVTDFGNIDNGLVCGFLKGDKLADYIYGPLTDKINEYCNSELCNEPYLPVVEEICLARLPPYPQWFRAVVAEHSAGAGTATVLFIDYGNVEAAVPVANLRKCMPEFCKEPALAATADIKQWPETASTEQIARAVEFLSLNEEGRGTLHVTRCEHVPEDRSYIIEVPDLIAAINAV